MYARSVSFDRRTLNQTGIAMAATRGRTAPRSYTLQVLGQRAGDHRPVALGARPVVVGAHATCDLVLADPQVSRKHAELSAVPEGIRIRDLGSTNGTWWQGTKVGEAVVPAGATVQFGGTPVRMAAADAPSLPPSERDRFGEMAGRSVGMRELFAVLELAAPTEATVLIEGESGTGKELAARAIHDASARASGPFVVVDCSAISEQLVDSHLFGHVRGAPRAIGAAPSSRPAGARCSSTSSVSSRSHPRASSCASSRRRPCNRSAPIGRCPSTRASSPPLTAISRAWWRPRSSDSICSTASPWCTSRSRRCASGSKTCRT
jgi:pSer/pThr/pTyr-binding forkhead associated (FHA) protein